MHHSALSQVTLYSCKSLAQPCSRTTAACSCHNLHLNPESAACNSAYFMLLSAWQATDIEHCPNAGMPGSAASVKKGVKGSQKPVRTPAPDDGPKPNTAPRTIRPRQLHVNEKARLALIVCPYICTPPVLAGSVDQGLSLCAICCYKPICIMWHCFNT